MLSLIFGKPQKNKAVLKWLHQHLPLAHHSSFRVLNCGKKLIQARRLKYIKSISNPVYSDDSSKKGTASVLYVARDTAFYTIEYKFDFESKQIESVKIFSLSEKEGMQYLNHKEIDSICRTNTQSKK